jgi:hypothetical protein
MNRIEWLNPDQLRELADILEADPKIVDLPGGRTQHVGWPPVHVDIDGPTFRSWIKTMTDKGASR